MPQEDSEYYVVSVAEKNHGDHLNLGSQRPGALIEVTASVSVVQKMEFQNF